MALQRNITNIQDFYSNQNTQRKSSNSVGAFEGREIIFPSLSNLRNKMSCQYQNPKTMKRIGQT